MAPNHVHYLLKSVENLSTIQWYSIAQWLMLVPLLYCNRPKLASPRPQQRNRQSGFESNIWDLSNMRTQVTYWLNYRWMWLIWKDAIIAVWCGMVYVSDFYVYVRQIWWKNTYERIMCTDNNWGRKYVKLFAAVFAARCCYAERGLSVTSWGIVNHIGWNKSKK